MISPIGSAITALGVNEEGYIYGDVEMKSDMTLFDVFGDVFVLICAVLIAIAAVMSAVPCTKELFKNLEEKLKNSKEKRKKFCKNAESAPKSK